MNIACKFPARSIALLLLLVFLTSCIWELRFFSKPQLIQHFKKNRNAFDQLVLQWEADGVNGTLRYSRQENSITWMGQEINSQASTNQEEGIVGVPAAKLQFVLEAMKRLQIAQISTIGQKMAVEKRYIEIWFRGSDLSPYGVIYVPLINEPQYQTLLQYSSPNQPIYPYTRLEHLDGRWFYFQQKI